MDGLTDAQQAAVMFIAGLFYTISIMSIPAGAPWWVALLLAVLGAISMSIKEFLGDALSTTTASNNQVIANPSPSPITSPSPNAVQTSSPTPPSTVLPALPQGFSLSAAQAAGFKVYENAAGSVILLMDGEYTDMYGNSLGSPSLTGYTLL